MVEESDNPFPQPIEENKEPVEENIPAVEPALLG